MDFYYEWPHGNQVFNYDYNVGTYYTNAAGAANAAPNAAAAAAAAAAANRSSANNYYNAYQSSSSNPATNPAAANYYTYEKNYLQPVQNDTMQSFDNFNTSWSNANNYNLNYQQVPQSASQNNTLDPSSPWSQPNQLDTTNYTVQSYYDAYGYASLPMPSKATNNTIPRNNSIGPQAAPVQQQQQQQQQLYPDQQNYFAQSNPSLPNDYIRYGSSTIYYLFHHNLSFKSFFLNS